MAKIAGTNYMYMSTLILQDPKVNRLNELHYNGYRALVSCHIYP